MFNKLFSKKTKTIIEEVFSPCNGEVIPLSEVPDAVFAEKMMGDGMAVIPNSGSFFSPVNGQIVSIFPTKHAIGIRTDNGLEVLIHVGLDTVELDGKGFELLVQEQQMVKAGDPLVKVDLEYLENQNKEIVTPVLITNMEKTNQVEFPQYGNIAVGDSILKCHLS
ncbi:PTS sugar transporter subunit IIA [Bacillus tuaregi]|uniref:PTS sugar transporter subunit IIA n=1 Tax=Bacillus tuaregi TaxID=1816695 RepID=UPI0008F8461F|nr:PTS glucose transporter subunit IIA [Bacillus tuaregi]